MWLKCPECDEPYQLGSRPHLDAPCVGSLKTRVERLEEALARLLETDAFGVVIQPNDALAEETILRRKDTVCGS